MVELWMQTEKCPQVGQRCNLKFLMDGKKEEEEQTKRRGVKHYFPPIYNFVIFLKKNKIKTNKQKGAFSV